MYCVGTISNPNEARVSPASGVAVSRAGAFWQGFAFAYGYYYYPWQAQTPGAEHTNQ